MRRLENVYPRRDQRKGYPERRLPMNQKETMSMNRATTPRKSEIRVFSGTFLINHKKR